MKYLLDTHILLWAMTEDDNLTEEMKSIITSSENEIYFSIASVWEIAIKRKISAEKMPVSEEDFYRDCVEAGYKKLDIKTDHIFQVKNLERKEGAPEHKDPFDRLMVSQAKSEKMKFVTHDRLIPFYSEECILPV